MFLLKFFQLIQLHAFVFVSFFSKINLPISREDVEVVRLALAWHKSNAGLVVIFKNGFSYYASLVSSCITVQCLADYLVLVV